MAILETAISAAAPVVSQGVNALVQGSMNRKTRKFAKEMYQQQMSDNIKLWQMQNEYNAPASQMERLQQAGLNPNLVYGSGADAMSGPIRGADAPTWNPQSPKFDLAQSIQAYNDFRMRDAQVENVQAQTQVARQQAEYIKTQDLKTMMETDLVSPRIQAIQLANKLASDTIGYNTDASRLRAISAQQDYDFKTASYENILKAQVLDNLGRELKNAKTQMEKSYLQGMINKIKNEVRLQEPEVKFAEKFSGQRGMQGTGMAIQLLRTLLGK